MIQRSQKPTPRWFKGIPSRNADGEEKHPSFEGRTFRSSDLSTEGRHVGGAGVGVGGDSGGRIVGETRELAEETGFGGW